MRRLPLALAFALVLSNPVGAAEKGKDAKEVSLNLQPIGLPVTAKGVLVNYVFVSLKLVLALTQDPTKLHEREPFLRDQLVRMAARTPFNTPADLTRLDDVRLKSTVMALCRSTWGPGAVASVQVVTETPQRRTGLAGGTVAPLD